jgi:hypothetical protein
MGAGVIPGGKAAGAWRWPPTPSSVEVKERVQLYLYYPSGTSWPVVGWTSTLIFTSSSETFRTGAAVTPARIQQAPGVLYREIKRPHTPI